MADYKNNDMQFLPGKFNEFKQDKISVWIPADKVAEFIRLSENERRDLCFNIARKRTPGKATHYAYVSKKAPSIPAFQPEEKFQAPESLESEIKEQQNQIPF